MDKSVEPVYREHLRLISQPAWAVTPARGQGKIPGAEQSAPELCVTPGQTRKASPKSGTHKPHTCHYPDRWRICDDGGDVSTYD
eukprot:890049-Prymnesium_polylepis.1